MKKTYLSIILAFISTFTFSQSITIVSPSDGTDVPESFDITFDVENFTVTGDGSGDGYIKYTNNGTQTNITTYNPNDIYTSVITQGAFPGSNVFTLELVDNSGNSLVPAISQTITLNVITTTEISTLSDLRSGSIGSFYKLAFEAETYLTFKQNLRNQKYIQDDTGAILIDDVNGSILANINELDKVSNLTGKLTDFHGVLQFVPYDGSNVLIGSSGGFTIEDPSLNEVLTNWETYESELIGLTLPSGSFSFVGITPGELFVANTNYTITDGTTNLTFRTLFSDSDYIGTQIPSTFTALTGIVSEYDGIAQVTAMEMSDFIGATLSNQELYLDSFSVFPNPASADFINITSKNGSSTNVEVYNITGKKIMSTTTIGNKLNISTLNSGVYILKLSQGNKMTTKKIVVE